MKQRFKEKTLEGRKGYTDKSLTEDPYFEIINRLEQKAFDNKLSVSIANWAYINWYNQSKARIDNYTEAYKLSIAIIRELYYESNVFDIDTLDTPEYYHKNHNVEVFKFLMKCSISDFELIKYNYAEIIFGEETEVYEKFKDIKNFSELMDILINIDNG